MQILKLDTSFLTIVYFWTILNSSSELAALKNNFIHYREGTLSIKNTLSALETSIIIQTVSFTAYQVLNTSPSPE